MNPMNPMNPMNGGRKLLLAGLASLAVISTLMLADSSARSPEPTAPGTSGPHTWEVTGGPTPGTFSFPDGPHRGISVKGKITPPLPAGVTAGISAVVAQGCVPDNGDLPLDTGCVMGGAQGGSFTGYVKTGAGCLAANCAKVKLTYTTDAPNVQTYCVTLRNPDVSSYGTIDPQVTGIAMNVDVVVPIQVLGRDGQVNTAFDGTVTVVPGSLLASGVLIEGSSGMTTVQITEGLGFMTVRCENGFSGDTLTFDFLAGGRLSPCRTSLDVL